jgi:hypothetical protein
VSTRFTQHSKLVVRLFGASPQSNACPRAGFIPADIPHSATHPPTIRPSKAELAAPQSLRRTRLGVQGWSLQPAPPRGIIRDSRLSLERFLCYSDVILYGCGRRKGCQRRLNPPTTQQGKTGQPLTTVVPLPTDDGFVEITFASATGPSIESEEEGQLTRSARKPIAKQTSPLLTHFRFAAGLRTARLTAFDHGAMKELPRKQVIGMGPVGTCRTPKHPVPALE